MPSLYDWSATASSNGTVDGINIAEGCAAGNLNNALRSTLAVIRQSFATGLQSFLNGSAPLPVANGGTGESTYTNGQILIGNGTGLTKNTLTAGAGVTITNGAGTVTIAATGGTVTSVAASGGTTGLTFTGSPITSSGTLTLSGTLAVANGGTGATSASAARTNLGLGALATQGNVLLASQVSGSLPVANGGTAGTTAAEARTNLGVTGAAGQTWTATSLSVGVSYQNTTGRPIQVCLQADGYGYFQVSADGSTWVNLVQLRFYGSATPIVPAGHYYRYVGPLDGGFISAAILS